MLGLSMIRGTLNPNDVVGLPDGKGFYATNFLGTRRLSVVRILNPFCSAFACFFFLPNLFD
jgi:hypothetical protein